MKADLLWREKYEMKKCELEERTRKRESEEGKRRRRDEQQQKSFGKRLENIQVQLQQQDRLLIQVASK